MLTLAGQYIFSKKHGLEDVPSSLGCPSEHSSPSDGMNPIGASRAVSDAKHELFHGHSVSSSV